MEENQLTSDLVALARNPRVGMRLADDRILMPLEQGVMRWLDRHEAFEIGRVDSRIIGDAEFGEYDVGDLIAELIGDDDLEGLDDDMGEMGRRRRAQKRVQRVAQRAGMVAVPRSKITQALQSARKKEAAVRDMETMADGRPRTAGPRQLAASDQAELYLPFAAAVALAAAAGSTATLTANIQRAIQVHRVILAAMDTVAFTDALITVGVTGIQVGVDPIFVANGVAPAQAFAFNAVGVKLLAYAGAIGQQFQVNLTRPAAILNASSVSGWAVGVAAGR